MTWFEELAGFPESSHDNVHANLQVSGTRLNSLVNEQSYEVGRFSTPSLGELRTSTELPAGTKHRISLAELVADVRTLHLDKKNENAVFQVASQFNCLEMASPRYTPEDGVGIYEHDQTQGPACSICAGAGTIFRNYFTPVNGAIGQTSDNQIDCLADVGSYFRNSERGLWVMQNGYCFPTAPGLQLIEDHLAESDEPTLDDIRSRLRIGIHEKTQVTAGGQKHLVTQAFCSALPISYSDLRSEAWEHFPQLILDATYEATFLAAIDNWNTTGCSQLFLTLVGGGVFGNKLDWILNAIRRAMHLFAHVPLDIHLVSYGASKPPVAQFCAKFGL